MTRLILLIYILLVQTSCSYKSKEVIKLNNKGSNFIQQFQYDSAEYYFKKALEIDSNYKPSLNNLISVYIAKRDTQNAYALTDKLLKLWSYKQIWLYYATVHEIFSDSINAQIGYTNQLKELDSLIANTTDEKSLVTFNMGKGIILIYLGQDEKGRQLLSSIKNPPPMDTMTINMYLSMSRDEIISSLRKKTPTNTSSTVMP